MLQQKSLCALTIHLLKYRTSSQMTNNNWSEAPYLYRESVPYLMMEGFSTEKIAFE